MSINFIFIGLVVIMFGRFMCIFGTSYLSLLFKKKNFKVNFFELSMIWFAGVVRGAVSYALILTVKIKNPDGTYGGGV